VVVMARRLNTQWALVAVNNAREAKRVTVTLPTGWSGALADPLGGAAPQAAGGKLELEIGAFAGRVLITR
jgi:hypothetical protein